MTRETLIAFGLDPAEFPALNSGLLEFAIGPGESAKVRIQQNPEAYRSFSIDELREAAGPQAQHPLAGPLRMIEEWAQSALDYDSPGWREQAR